MLIGNLSVWYGQKEAEDDCLYCGMCRFI